jgi:hypothetical protein
VAVIGADDFAKHIFRVLSNYAQEFYAEDLTEDGVHDLDYTLQGNTITVMTSNLWDKTTQKFTIFVRG